MSSPRPGSARLFAATWVLSLLALAACGTDGAVTSPLDAIALNAKAAGGGGGVAVRSTEPDTGLRGTTIDVRVLGSGFDNGSRATWAINGDTSFAATKVKTNSTRFVKSGELVANITIADDAPLVLFDIVVVTMAGKNGIGIEKFTVKNTGSSDAYTVVFDDALGYQLRSDGGGTYADGGPNYDPNCVTSQRYGGGLYQLRTIAKTVTCKAVQRPAWRWFKIDLGVPGLDFDQDGVAEAIEDAPGRLLADNAFAQGATSTAVKILLFVVNADGSTTQDQKYELRFRTGVSVTDIGNESRILEAAAGNATVDIYNKWKAGNPVGPPIATIQLPFKLTLNPM
jgi:hypothetical protein